EQGIDAKCAALEGPAGLYHLFYDGQYDYSIIAEGMGDRFYALDTVFKRWPTSGVVHPFIEACLELHTRHKIDPAAIDKVCITAGPPSKLWLEPVEERRYPRNAATAAN